MKGALIRQKFLEFFKQKGHIIIPSASLIPENDPSVLFTTAGMHPLVPYLLGEPHPGGRRLCDVQKCLRTTDIEEVGDEAHLTFFEMLGNWSLGDYFKKEAIGWSFQFMTDKKWMGVNPNRLAISVFAGDKDSPRDEESAKIWKSLGVPKDRIAYLGKEENWWPASGKNPGPQGPDTEIFIWTAKEDPPKIFNPEDKRWVEIWNNVFMGYNRTPNGLYEQLKQKNIDTGMGLERMAACLQGVSSVYETDLFEPIMKKIQELAGPMENEEKKRVARIIADHLRASAFILGDPAGIEPSNLDQGYILRRLIRRAVRYGGQTLGLNRVGWTKDIAKVVVENFGDVYPELRKNEKRICDELTREEERFVEALKRGLFYLQKNIKKIDTKDPKAVADLAFYIYETHGFPFEMTQEEMEKGFGVLIDKEKVWPYFTESFEKHQQISRAGAGKKFKGGLADHSKKTVCLHTATHLLHRALKDVLGEAVEQKGSNITPERLRFDFNFSRKMTKVELKKVEDIINEQIRKGLPVHFEELNQEEAKKRGAVGYFDDKYAKLGNKLKVYFIGSEGDYFSYEICGGPHAANTSELGKFKILKEESSSGGVRRIKATLDF